MVGEGCPGHGPLHLLSSSAAEIGFFWDPGVLAWVRLGLPINSIPPIQQNSMKNGYDENNIYNKSDENKCEINYSSTHTVKEQFAPEENRDIASFNTDNQFNRAINEENIDFNIPGLPHSAVKRSHGVNVQNLIQKIETHPQRQALQSDLQQHRAFNPFSKESRDVIKAAGNTELRELLDVEPKAQCKVCLSY